MDALRVFAAFSVVLLHAAARSWDKQGADFAAAAVFDTAVRYSVPVFVMLSGVFMLDPEREMPLKKLYGKHVLRLLLLLVPWSLGYALLNEVALPLYQGETVEWERLFTLSFLGDYHFWYLLMIIGLYLAVPILRRITQDPKTLWYTIGFWALFGVLGRMISTMPGCSSLGTLLLDRAHLHFFFGYSGYFLLGYALHTLRLTGKQERLLGMLWPLGFLLTASATLWFSGQVGKHLQRYMSNFSVFVLMEAVGVFLFFDRSKPVERVLARPHFARLVSFLSPLTLGIYLIHPAILSICVRVFHRGPALLLVPVHFIVALLAGIAFAFCMKKIPLLRRLV